MSAIIVNRTPTPAVTSFPSLSSRWLAAAVFVTGAALQVAEFALERPPDDNGARVATWLAHPTATAASMALGLLAVPFLLGGFAVLLSITVRHARKLSLAAGALLVAAMVGLAGVHGVEMTAFATASDGDTHAAISILDGKEMVAPMLVLLVLFLVGAVLGTLTLAAAMWRSPALPRVAAAGVIAFAVLDFAIGMPVVSHTVALLNAFVVGWAIVAGRSRAGRDGAH